VFEIIGGMDNVPDVFLGQNGGKVAYVSAQTIVNADFLLGDMVVEKAQAAQSAGTAVGALAFVIFQIQQIVLDHLFGKRVGRFTIVFGNAGNGGKISALGVGGKVSKFHGPDHFLT
jgi:hypothetical protein